MTHQIRIPSPLRRFTDGQGKLEVQGQTVKTALEELFERYPELKLHLVEEDGNLRNFVNIYVDGEDIRSLDRMETRLEDKHELRIIPAIAGGSNLEPQEMARYARHFSLPEFGLEGQKKLKAAKVLVIGTGGLGSPTALYLAAAGVGHLGLVDFDKVDESNLQRQVLFGISNLGQSKVQSAEKRLRDLNPYLDIQVYETALTSENAMQIIEGYDLVVDGTDNFATRYLVNDACVLQGVPNVYGSIFRFEGQASVFNYEDGPCYRCLYPKPPPPGLVPSCAEGGVLGVLPGIIGCIQTNEAIKILAGMGDTLKGRLMLFDALAMEFSELKLARNPECPICGDQPSITELIDYKEFCGLPSVDQHPQNGHGEIDVRGLKQLFDSEAPVVVLDVREGYEREIATIQGTTHIPMNDVANRLHELDRDSDIIVQCRSGVRSQKICNLLTQNGFEKVRNLKGGILAWSEQIDPSIPTY